MIRTLSTLCMAVGVLALQLDVAYASAHYWLGDSNTWGLYGEASNWALDTADSDTHATPRSEDTIALTKDMKWDLGGASWAVSGATNTSAHTISITNGTLTIEGDLQTGTRFDVWDGATAIIKTSTYRFWGCACYSDTITVHSGGRYEERGDLQFQGYRATIETEGTYVHAVTSYGPHPGLPSAQDIHNYGRMEAPNGIRRFRTWDTTKDSASGSVTHWHHDGSTLLLGGPVARNMQEKVPFNMRFESCTLIVSNDVSFASDMNLVKIEDNASLAVEVLANSSLDLSHVTIGTNVTISKTGPGRLIIGTPIGTNLTIATGEVELGAGTATTNLSSIVVERGATLAVVGGSADEPIDLPVLTLNHDARLLVKEDAVAQMTNTFTTIGDATQLPILEIATNATLIAQTPGGQTCIGQEQWYTQNDYGFRLKNVSLKWYGNLQMFCPDTGANWWDASRLWLGYAAKGETSYIAIDCRGGTWTASGEANSFMRNRTPLAIALASAGGTVIPVGTLLFRDFTRIDRDSATINPEYVTHGLYIGYNNGYEYNPDSVAFDVVFDGASDYTVVGYLRIGSGAHVQLKGVKWDYTQRGWNDSGLVRTVQLYAKGTLDVTDGALLDLPPANNTGRGLVLNGSARNRPVFTARNATLGIFNWSGANNATGIFDHAKLQIGILRTYAPTTLVERTDVFRGMAAAQLDAGGLTLTAADIWREKNLHSDREWSREVTMGVPLTGTGGLTITNDLPEKLASYGMTVTIKRGDNTATGVAKAEDTLTGPAKLVFADGANWAGTVIANKHLALTNLTDGANAITVSFHALRMDTNIPIRVWKTGGKIVTNDMINLETAVQGKGRFELIPMDEPFDENDEIDLGLYPAHAKMPQHIYCRSTPSHANGFVTLRAKCKPAGTIFALCFKPSVCLYATNTEVVISAQAPKTVSFAAQVLTNFLSQAFGAIIPLVNAPTTDRVPILLGEELWEIPEVSIDAIARDGSAFAVRNGRVYIAGKDDATINPINQLKTPGWGTHQYEHATLNGVYDFLENIVGIRFYFPGELGTCVRPVSRIGLSDKVRIDEPQHTVRTWSFFSDGEWYEGENPVQTCHPQKAINVMRLRASTQGLGCCHGLNGFCYVARFGETHPEYFALDSSGNRMIEGSDWRGGHLCFSSAITNEIFLDCLSYLKGEEASVRGIPGMYAAYSWGKKFDWHTNVSPLCIDIMPQDGNAECYCDACQAKMRNDGRSYRASELVWGMVKGISDRLAAEGHHPILTCMSYADYADTPDFKLPDNVRVMIAKTGPWITSDETTIASDNAFFDKWTAATGKLPWTWNYPNRGDCNHLTDFDVPGWAPAAWGKYYAGIAPHVFGTFSESETERCIDHLLGYYLKQHIDWNHNYNWKAALSSFYGHMFGAAAAPMKHALEAIEHKFIYDIAGHQQMTGVGPVAEVPSQYKLWREIYSESEMDALKDDFDAAAAAVPADSLEGRRVALFRKWMYDPPRKAGDAYRELTDVDNVMAWNAAHPDANMIDESRWNIGGVKNLDTTDFLTEPSSFRMTSTTNNSTMHFFGYLKSDVTMKPATRYRFSYFVKTQNLVPTESSGGVGPMIALSSSNPKWEKSYVFPSNYVFLSGTVPWLAQVFEFETPDDMPENVTVGIWPRIRYAAGTAWFDEIRLEELPPSSD